MTDSGILSGAILFTREPREASIYYEWLLERSTGQRPGAGLKTIGVSHVVAPGEHDESARGWIPVFAVDDISAAEDRVRDRGVEIRRDILNEPPVAFAVNSSGMWTGLRLVPATEPEKRPGEFMNCDYSAMDIEVASRTLAQLLGADRCEIVDDPFEMRILHVGRRVTAGVLQLAGIEAFSARPYWVTYFEVPDIDRATVKAVESGSRVLIPPTASPFNRYAILRDPWGNVFGLSCLDADTTGTPVRVRDEAGRPAVLTDIVDLH